MEQAFGRWFADGLYRGLVPSATQAISSVSCFLFRLSKSLKKSSKKIFSSPAIILAFLTEMSACVMPVFFRLLWATIASFPGSSGVEILTIRLDWIVKEQIFPFADVWSLSSLKKYIAPKLGF